MKEKFDVESGASMFGIQADIRFVKSIIPEHYTVTESKKKGSIHCVSKIGFRKNIDADDEVAFDKFFQAIKKYFGSRFQETYCNVCTCYMDFTIYLKL